MCPLNYCAGTPLVFQPGAVWLEGEEEEGPACPCIKIGEWKAAGPLLKEPAAAASSGAVARPSGSGMHTGWGLRSAALSFRDPR